NDQQEPEAERLFQEEINKKRRKYKRIILENIIIEDDLFNLFITGLDAENIIIQK
ncbi:3829_t:CDS:1, partial [Scutellospora calospora]